MDQVLTCLNEFCNVYTDDIIVYSTEWTQHISHLRQVLERLRQYNLTAKPKKYVWSQR